MKKATLISKPISVFTASDPSQRIFGLAALLNGDLLVSAVKSVQHWSSNGKTCLGVFSGHTDVVSCLDVVNEKHFVSGSWDHSLKLWCLETKKCVADYVGHTDWINHCLVLTHPWNKNLMASSSDDKTVRLWKLDDPYRQCLYTLKGHKDYVWKLCELHDGTIASGSMDRTIKVWNIRIGKGMVPHCIRTLSGHSGFVRGVIEWQPGVIVSSSTNHQVLYVWDLNSSNNNSGHQCTKCELVPLKPMKGSIFALILLVDGTIVTGSEDDAIRGWNIKGECLFYCESKVWSLCILKGGLIASGTLNGCIELWKVLKDLTLVERCCHTLTRHISLKGIQKLYLPQELYELCWAYHQIGS